jgi:hypothetical protein
MSAAKQIKMAVFAGDSRLPHQRATIRKLIRPYPQLRDRESMPGLPIRYSIAKLSRIPGQLMACGFTT